MADLEHRITRLEERSEAQTATFAENLYADLAK